MISLFNNLCAGGRHYLRSKDVSSGAANLPHSTKNKPTPAAP
jgi:hypothetical protein